MALMPLWLPYLGSQPLSQLLPRFLFFIFLQSSPPIQISKPNCLVICSLEKIKGTINEREGNEEEEEISNDISLNGSTFNLDNLA
jgi:hypothetical protein